MNSDDSSGSTQILTGPLPSRGWRLVWWGAVVLIAVAWGISLTRSVSFWVVLPLIPASAGLIAMLIAWLRPPRIELREYELLLRYIFHSHRIPYVRIASVHGDVPTRLNWSTRLHMELRDGRTITLPLVEQPLRTLVGVDVDDGRAAGLVTLMVLGRVTVTARPRLIRPVVM